MKTLKKKIKRRRDYIDKIDTQLVNLLNKRASYAREIGRIKIKAGIKARSCQREEEVIRNVLAINRGPLSANAVKRLFKLIINESRNTECAVMKRIKKKPINTR
jgi:chorismate mutase